MGMNEELNYIEDIKNSDVSLEYKVDVLIKIANRVYDKGKLRAKTVKYKLRKYLESNDVCERAYALVMLTSDENKNYTVPNSEELVNTVEIATEQICEEVTAQYVETEIEKKVEGILNEKQDKYMDDIRLSIIRKEKGCENSKTEKKYEELVNLDKRITNKNIMSFLRPESFDDIVGQERAIKSLISKLSSPYPQHIILYGPPGVGKTTAARVALEEVKKSKITPFNEESKFVEVDGTTLRWDPREITNPLLGSVHDPIYQGSKRDLADIGVPEPKPGLVTEAHGGILFIDEIGELDNILQNKLLKVLEDKRVEFSSSYYDPDDESTPNYIKYLFDNGAPADFVLIGATTREPSEINPALRSRCTEVYFEPLASNDIELIVEKAADKLQVSLEEGVAELISRYTIEGRKAVNILTDAYGYNICREENTSNRTITLSDVQEILSIGRYIPFEREVENSTGEVGHIFGLGVSGFVGSTLEIEGAIFPASKKGSGTVRFNETAGSMAKDSVYNAASVIRKFTDKDIRDYDIHVNIVGGGKIDGPSAGAAITMCVISALLDKPLRQDIALTGEISLRGKVKPVGGIFEKIYGARRKGIKLVLIPKDNEDEVPKELKDIEVKAIENIEELMEIVFYS